MKNQNSNNLSFFYSAIVSSTVLLCLVLCNFYLDMRLNWSFVFTIPIVIMAVSFLVMRKLLYSFIYNRIRLIYKTINKRKTGGKAGYTRTFNYHTDLIKMVETDVASWAHEQEVEIEKMREMNDYRKEFVGNVSHELKTPIFNIQGYTLTLLEGGLEDENINERYLKKIEKNINRMINIVNDLDAITKLESGQLKLRIQNIDPIIFCDDIIESLEDFSTSKNINIKIIKHYDKSFLVKADKEFLRQVFTNLLVNSINYNNDGGYVKVEFFEMDKNILIEVTDNGVGIPPDDLPRVFERFYRVDKSRSLNSGGSGLGLAIVKHIIEAHGQTVNVRSTLGVGTTIAFTMSKV
ncbi:MAG: sensor histidine kinase [Bacteroidales bacterium]|nr:sensor histidine kinase [Bacteroidales bacterium]